MQLRIGTRTLKWKHTDTVDNTILLSETNNIEIRVIKLISYIHTLFGVWHVTGKLLCFAHTAFFQGTSDNCMMTEYPIYAHAAFIQHTSDSQFVNSQVAYPHTHKSSYKKHKHKWHWQLVNKSGCKHTYHLPSTHRGDSHAPTFTVTETNFHCVNYGHLGEK